MAHPCASPNKTVPQWCAVLRVVWFLCYLRHCVTPQANATGLSAAPKKKGGGFMRQKEVVYVRHHPIGLFGRTRHTKRGGQYSVFLASGKFLTLKTKIKRKLQPRFSGWRNLLKCLAWRVGCRLVCLVYITLVFCLFFVGHLFMTREHAIPSCPGPRLSQPCPGCPESHLRAGLWCSLSAEGSVHKQCQQSS